MRMRADDQAASDERIAHLGVDDEVDVALAEARLDVLEPVPFLRQRQQVLRKVTDFSGRDGQLVGAGPEKVAFRTDDVAQVEQLEELEVLGADVVLTHIYLDPVLPVGHVHEPGLAVGAERHDAAAHANVLFGLLEFGSRRLIKLLPDLGDGVAVVEPARVGVETASLQLVELGSALDQQVCLVLHRLLIHFWQPEIVFDAVEDSVDELGGFVGREFLGNFQRFIDDDGAGRAAVGQELVDGQPQDVTVDRRHPAEAPVLRVLLDRLVDFLQPVERALEELVRERAHFRRLLVHFPERLQDFLPVELAYVVLIKHLKCAFARGSSNSHCA